MFSLASLIRISFAKAGREARNTPGGGASTLVRWLARRWWMVGPAFLVTAILAAHGWAQWGYPEVPLYERSPTSLAASRPVKIKEVRGQLLWTDAGSVVKAYRAAESPDLKELADVDVLMTANFVPEELLCNDGPGLGYNCHGWTFTGGLFWIQSEDVATILEDNDYEPVDFPEPGDLVVYQDGNNNIIHTGVVHSFKNGEVMVESKWGKAGRYVHAVDDQIYSSNFTYFHSSREGNLLVGISPAQEVVAPADAH